jgi:HK97 family phage major capsid protein
MSRSIVEQFKAEARADFQRQADALLREAMKPDRSQLPELTPSGTNRHGEPVHRLGSPAEPLYRRMSEEERRWRSPEADYLFARWLRATIDRDHAVVREAEDRLGSLFRADVSEGVAGASGAFATGTGGTLVPRPLERVVMIARDRVAKMRRFARIVPMTAQQVNLPTAASMTAAMVAEGTSGSGGEPTFSQVALVAKTGCVKAVASREMVADSDFRVVQSFVERGAGALGVLEDDECFKLGDGTGNHITKLSGTAFAEVSTGIFKYTDALLMYRSVPQVYRDRGVWLVSSDVLGMMGNVRDGQGRPFYGGMVDSPTPISDDRGAIGTLLHRPVYEVPFTSGEVWFGDPEAQYAFGDRQGIEVDVSRDVLFDTRQIMWLLTERFAGNNVDSSASQYCVGLTSASSL